MSAERPELAAEMQRRSRSFDAWAFDYDRYRPTYPAAMFDHISNRLGLGPNPLVADLGAGTGKAARAMARRGWNVIALEPGEGMLDVLRARTEAEGLPIEAHLAPAEATGLDDSAVDLVTVAQAFHWFDKPRAVDEMARITRPGGGVAIFWNVRDDDRSAFLAAYTELTGRFLPEEHVDRRVRESSAPAELSSGGWFTVDDRVEISHQVSMSHDDFIGLAFTASQVRLFVDGPSQRRLMGELRDLLAEYFGESNVVVPYDVDVYVGRRT